MSSKHAVVAVSGGVDSSVAALLLVEAGYTVTAIMLRLWSAADPGGKPNRCCTPEGVDDARRVATILGIPFYLVDCEDRFRSAVVETFIAEYARGRTPNPCLACNRSVRFAFLLDYALRLGADFLATGHYARITHENSRYRLWRGADTAKDQSYVLYMLGQQQLARVLFPVGGLLKSHVRALAQKRGLPAAAKWESQDVCFLPDGDYRSLLRQHGAAGLEPGPIFNQQGHLLGQHRGFASYTIGQHRGLGLAVGRRLFVTAIDPARNAVIVGEDTDLLRSHLMVSSVTYVSGESPGESFSCAVRVRYRAPEARAVVTPLADGRASVVFDQPQRAVTPGQAAVFYRGDEVLGGGIIE